MALAIQTSAQGMSIHFDWQIPAPWHPLSLLMADDCLYCEFPRFFNRWVNLPRSLQSPGISIQLLHNVNSDLVHRFIVYSLKRCLIFQFSLSRLKFRHNGIDLISK
jgi:hypothetical protein